jgi:hypothetical protein
MWELAIRRRPSSDNEEGILPLCQSSCQQATNTEYKLQYRQSALHVGVKMAVTILEAAGKAGLLAKKKKKDVAIETNTQ